ncbi:MAG: hypothetical protein ACOCVR_01290 [Myxococcota bacterium]
MNERGRVDVEVSAWLDGELEEERAREVEARVQADSRLRAEIAQLRGAGTALKRTVDRAEARVNFAGFSDAVMAALDDEAAEAEPDEREAREDSFWSRLRHGLSKLLATHRPALAAAATMLVILGGSSFYFLLSQESGVKLDDPLVLKGGPTVIEDLTFGDASAVVFRTDADVTVIWVSED